MNVKHIISGILAERESIKEYFKYEVQKRERLGNLWILLLNITSSEEGFDESLEQAKAWWKDKNGNQFEAQVLAVLPDEEKIVLRYVTGTPPKKGEFLHITPHDYLKKLLNAWHNKSWVRSVQTWKEQSFDKFYESNVLYPKHFQWLRTNQKKIFNAIGYRASFLLGPPGTGKTTTLGALLAEYISTFPNKKVLVLSTTNLAVDQALVAVDKSLEEINNKKIVKFLRTKMYRIGNNFISKYYDNRRYLLPVENKKLIDELKHLENSQPPKNKIEEFAKWQEKIDFVREQIKTESKQVLKDSTLVAMTATRAIYTLDDLKEVAPYDLVVFDESSQVGLAHALMLSPLGKFCIFTGDPNQLAPIVTSKQKYAKEWLGESIFSYKCNINKQKNIVFLNEQSRMASQICKLVSNLFYDGKLIVAKDAISDKKWKKERDLSSEPDLDKDAVIIINVNSPGTWSKKYHGPIRYESAKKLIPEILEKIHNLEDTIILTPFRAQRTLINHFLRKNNIKAFAKTVHRSQGSEFRTVIFDPVDATNNFLKTKNAEKLINVALSRAKARLIILLHKKDLENKIFKQIYDRATCKFKHHKQPSLSS